jgi:hypothetical protein
MGRGHMGSSSAGPYEERTPMENAGRDFDGMNWKFRLDMAAGRGVGYWRCGTFARRRAECAAVAAVVCLCLLVKGSRVRRFRTRFKRNSRPTARRLAGGFLLFRRRGSSDERSATGEEEASRQWGVESQQPGKREEAIKWRPFAKSVQGQMKPPHSQAPAADGEC